jgi:hypothetical protein
MTRLLRSIVVVGLFVAGCGDDSGSTTPAADTDSVTTTGEVAPASTSSATATTSATTSTVPPPSTTTSAAPLDPRVEEALEVATEFMHGFADRDMEVIEATSVEGHVFAFTVDAFERFPDEFAWLDAIGWVLTVNDCTVTNPDVDNTTITCSVTHENAWSRALGVGPYDGEFFVGVSIPGQSNWVYPDRDEPVVTTRAFAQFPTFFFTRETWEPFIDWVDANHPDDLPLMLSSIQPPETSMLSAWPTLTPESIELWRTRTEEFVAGADS